MGRNSYLQSTTSSTRTFQTKPVSKEKAPAKPKRAPIKFNFKLPAMPKIAMPNTAKATQAVKTNQLPWTIAVVLAVVSLFLLVQYHDAQNKLHGTPAAAASKQVTNTVNAVAKLVVVPTGETPTVATVADVAKLKTQSFFANAKNGDKVIVYTKAREAILYRPSTNQIVTMAPVASSANGQ